MLVRRMLGRDAGEVIDMSAPDALRAIQGGAVEALTESEAAAYASGTDKVNDVRALVSVAKPPVPVVVKPKGKGGWPKGKKRGPKIAPVSAPELTDRPPGAQ